MATPPVTFIQEGAMPNISTILKGNLLLMLSVVALAYGEDKCSHEQFMRPAKEIRDVICDSGQHPHQERGAGGGIFTQRDGHAFSRLQRTDAQFSTSRSGDGADL
ncbi:hypothetical protein GMSM_40350 [Geomonas sp. Red276]